MNRRRDQYTERTITLYGCSAEKDIASVITVHFNAVLQGDRRRALTRLPSEPAWPELSLATTGTLKLLPKPGRLFYPESCQKLVLHRYGSSDVLVHSTIPDKRIEMGATSTKLTDLRVQCRLMRGLGDEPGGAGTGSSLKQSE
jgi:hypothetical protein